MAEHIERKAAIDSIAALARKNFSLSDNYEIYLKGLKDANAVIEALPAANVRPVVTCRECKFWYQNGTDLCSCEKDALLRPGDYVCERGERKENNG